MNSASLGSQIVVIIGGELCQFNGRLVGVATVDTPHVSTTSELNSCLVSKIICEMS